MTNNECMDLIHKKQREKIEGLEKQVRELEDNVRYWRNLAMSDGVEPRGSLQGSGEPLSDHDALDLLEESAPTYYD